MKPLDWIVAAIPVVIVIAIALYTQRYMKSVADFMSGRRLAGRYLLAVAKAEMTAGAVVYVALFEIIAHSGFVVFSWWNWLTVLVGFIITISGFVVYRYRETRAMTLAQFFELRYSKNFRLFTGFLAFFAGILNFGIMPCISAQFFVYFMGLPPMITFGPIHMATYIPIMGALLSMTLYMTLAGGMVTLIITNCIQGILSQVFYLIIVAGLLATFHWSQISEVLSNRPPGQSLLNPFDSAGVKDFNIWYVLMTIAIGIYGTMAWQNQGAYNSAGITAHETRMGGVLGRIRELGTMGVVTLLAVCGLTFLEHPDFAAQAQAVQTSLQHIQDISLREQMRVPIALALSLPMGVKGALCAVLLLGSFGGDSNHLHSWGSIFVQDLLVPLRKKPFGPKQHILILRLTISAVALAVFIFGCFFKLTDYIMMWWQVTTAIFVGGAGAAIIGGLYWSKGTTAGAWGALLTGSTLSVVGIFAQQLYGPGFLLNGMQISFIATILAVAVYVVLSLLTHKADFNMDRMLHRGKYAVIKTVVGDQPEPVPEAKKKLSWGRFIGIDEHFTTADKWIAGGMFAWSIFWCLVVVVGSIWNLIAPWPISAWSTYWHISGVGLPILIAVVAAVWLTWGGIRDMRDFFRRLREDKINHLDDGTVVGHLNLDEEVPLHQENPPLSPKRDKGNSVDFEASASTK